METGMEAGEWVGSIGVGLLLVAFALNLMGRTSASSPVYQGLNFVGAGLACSAAVLIRFFPFVILEGTWCLTAAVALVLGWKARRASLTQRHDGC